MDGNFVTAPLQFLQIYVIRVADGEGAVTRVYAFMRQKTRNAYVELLENI